MDILLFNPPYVPTDLDEADEAQHVGGIAGAWAGGQDGMTVTDILLDEVEVWLAITVARYRSNAQHYLLQDLLSPRGRFYLVAVKENDIPGIFHRMQEQYDLKGEVRVVSYRTWTSS